MSPRTLFTSEYCPPGHYSPVNNVPSNVPPRARASKLVCGQGGLAFVFAKFRALQLAAGNTHGPDNSGATHNPRSYSSQGYALSLT